MTDVTCPSFYLTEILFCVRILATKKFIEIKGRKKWMEKTAQELSKKLYELLDKIIRSSSSFEAANLSREAYKTVGELEDNIKNEGKNQESKLEPKLPRFDEIEFKIPNSAEIITKESLIESNFAYAGTPIKQRLIRFDSHHCGYTNSYVQRVKNFCLDILKKLIETDSYGEKITLDAMIEILEKKGLKIKICGNCEYFKQDPDIGKCPADDGFRGRIHLAQPKGACTHPENPHAPENSASPTHLLADFGRGCKDFKVKKDK